MKHMWNTLRRYAMWLALLLLVDGFSALLLWIADIYAFERLSGMIVLFSLVLFVGILLVVSLQERKKQKAFLEYLSDPSQAHEQRLMHLLSHQQRESVQLLSKVLRGSLRGLQHLGDDLKDYEEYVELWAHEAKMPIALLTMILDNRGDEMTPQVQAKLDYVRNRLQEDVSQMLYYARLKSATKDYRFEAVELKDLLEEVLEDYAPLLQEKGFAVDNRLTVEQVYTDRRGLQFMLGQIISNSVKYSKDDPVLHISAVERQNEWVLRIADNGTGVKAYDLPYLFQKGFTGDTSICQKKATGMGLYLVKKMSEELCLNVTAQSEWGKGFAVSIGFPKTEKNR